MTLVPVSTFTVAPDAFELARQIASTEFVPTALRNRREAVAAAILFGHEAGVGPMESLAKINVIEGRPAFSSELMRAQVIRHGHRIWADETTTTRATMCGQRNGEDHVHRVTWTLDDARKAGLAGRPNWTRYPRNMLIARATSDLCRLAFPDVLGAARYSVEELEDGDSNGFAPQLDPAPEPAKQKRRRPPPPKVIDVPADTPVTTAVALDEVTVDLRPPLPGEPLEPVEPMSDSQRKRMMAAFRNAGITERGNRLIYASKIVGRTLTTAAELNGTEATAVIDALEQTPPPPPEPDDDEPRPDLFTPGAYEARLTPPPHTPEPMNLGQYRTIMQEFKAIGLGDSRTDRLALASLILMRPITDISAMSDITVTDGERILDALRRIHKGELTLVLDDEANIVGYGEVSQ